MPALEAAGFDPADVRYLLQSHLHLDHSGGLAAIEAFPNAEVIATRTDYEYAHAPDWYADAVYIDEDFRKPGVRWALLDDNEDGYDVFGDGIGALLADAGPRARAPVVRGQAAEQRRVHAHDRRRVHERTTGRSGRSRASWPPPWTPSARSGSCTASPAAATPPS